MSPGPAPPSLPAHHVFSLLPSLSTTFLSPIFPWCQSPTSHLPSVSYLRLPPRLLHLLSIRGLPTYLLPLLPLPRLCPCPSPPCHSCISETLLDMAAGRRLLFSRSPADPHPEDSGAHVTRSLGPPAPHPWRRLPRQALGFRTWSLWGACAGGGPRASGPGSRFKRSGCSSRGRVNSSPAAAAWEVPPLTLTPGASWALLLLGCSAPGVTTSGKCVH